MKFLSQEQEIMKKVTIEECKTTIEAVSKEKEINFAIKELKPDKDSINEITFVKTNSRYGKLFEKFDEHCGKGISFNNFDIVGTIKSLGDELCNEIDEEDIEIFDYLKKSLSNAWEGKEMSENEKEIFTNVISVPKSRKLLYEAFNNYNKSGMCKICPNGFQMVSELLLMTLTQIENTENSEDILAIEGISQLFYLDNLFTASNGKGENFNKMFLHYGLLNHTIWRKEGIWEKAINTAIKKILSVQVIGEETKEEKDMRIKNQIVGRLGKISKFMVCINIDEKEIRSIIIDHAKKFSLSEPYIIGLNVFH